MKMWLLSLVALGLSHGAMAAVCVTNVTATFRTRAEGVVEIAYEVTSDDPDADVWLMFEGWDRDRGLAVFPKTLSGDGTRGPVKPGMHSTVWHVAADRPSFHSSAFCLKVTAVTGLSPYRILDLSGDSASGFSVHDAAQGPSFADDSQYTTNLWMRLVLPGTFIMGSPDNEIGREKTYNNERQHQVTLTQPYYIGVIQTTRKQWALVTGAPVVPSSSGRKTETEETLRLPEDDVSYDMIRGTDLGAQWPSSQDVDADSFIGTLRSRTSRLYDLPTEAQWEYACRAGTTTALNSGKDLTSTNHCPNMAEAGRYGGNRNADGSYWNCSTGGMYLPNNWGLFDMHGNGCEWCLDRDGYISSAAVVDPKGNSTSSASMRVCRKGSFTSGADRHRSAQRFSTNSKSRWGTSLSFRLVEHLEAPEGFSFWGVESNEFRLELRDVETLDESLEDGSVVEAGRLLADTVWSNDVVHVIRDWVTVPSGVTLTIVPGTTVKFYNDSGIWVMGGGTVCAHGEEGAPISFKSIDSSTPADWRVVTVNDGEWLSNEFLSADNVPCDDGSVTISSATDKVLVSCDWSAPPGSPIVITWQTLDGTAKAGIDYTEVSGCVTQEWPYASFYVEVPVLLPDEQKNDREFAVEFRADGAGINAVWTRKVVLYDSVLVARKDVSVGDECVSGGCFVDLRGIGETIKVEGDREIAYDTAWDGSADGVEVKVIAPDGRERTIVAESGDASGIVRWTPDAGSGCYIMEHRTSGGLLTARMAVPDAACARVGTRRLTTAETWTADKVYLVDGELTIADGGSLTIQPGTVVKFTPGSKLLTVNGGVCEAPGVTFTHVNDDSVGGDTLCDGNQSYPVAGQYTISGRVLDDDATVYRYMGAIMTLWTINTDTVWHSGQVYVLPYSLVISNATLKIMPGVTVKIAKGKSITVRDDGRIDASGTRAQPIVFTSIFDDAHGGDTNGDGDNTLPQPGDWARIHNYGEVSLRNCKVLYASSGGMSGAVFARRGRVSVVDSEIAHSAYDAIGAELDADVYVTNCVIRDALAAFRHYITNDIVNCVVYDCGRITQGGTSKFRNCVFSEITDVWQSGQQPNNFRNCCFWNKDGTKLTGDVAWQVDQTQIVTQDASVYLNRNGNVWGDPLFADPMNGDFRIKEGSACVDAADGTVVPETDLYGQPRVTLLGEPSGIPTSEGCVPDIGVSELMPRNMSADVDFEARSVAAAGPVAPGDEITVKWTVGNIGGREVDGSWRDTVSLVSANGRVVTLGEKVTTGRVPAGGSIACSASFTVPTLAEGAWYPKVQVNTCRDVFEGSLTANNAVQGTDPVEVSVAAADMSAAVAGRIVAGVPTVLKLPFTEDASNRLVRMTLPEGVSASWGFGFMPQGVASSGTAVASGNDVCFLAPDGEQAVYVVLESGTTADYLLTFEDNPLVISSISPTSIPKSGTTSIIVTGAGFTPSNTVSFTSASGAVAPESVRYVNANTLVATVDCGKFTSGATYAARTSVDILTTSLASALIVTDEEGKGQFWAKLIVPDTVRKGRRTACYIEYGNSGNIDITCQILRVDVTGDCRLSHVDESTSFEYLYFLATGGNPTFGYLRSNEVKRIPFVLTTGINNQLTLTSSWNESIYDKSWNSADEFLLALSIASNRIGMRNEDSTDYIAVLDYAKKSKNEGVPGVVRGYVCDDHATGLKGISVVCTGENDVRMSITDEHGAYSFEDLTNGCYSISISGHDIISFSGEWGKDLYLGTVKLDMKPSVKVELIGSGTSESVEMSLYDEEHDLKFYPIWNSLSCATFYGLSNGVYILSSVQKDGLVSKRFVPVVSNEVTELCLDVSTVGKITVTTSGYVNYDNMYVLLFDSTGEIVDHKIPEGNTTFFDDILDGDYQVLIGQQTGSNVVSEVVSITNHICSSVEISVDCGSFDDVAVFDFNNRTVASVSVASVLRTSNISVDDIDDVVEQHLKQSAKVLARPLKRPSGDYDCVHNRKQYDYYKKLISELKSNDSQLQTALYAYNAGYWLRWGGRFENSLALLNKAASTYLEKKLGPVVGAAAGAAWSSAFTILKKWSADELKKGEVRDIILSEMVKAGMSSVPEGKRLVIASELATMTLTYFNKVLEGERKMEAAAKTMNKYYPSAKKNLDILDVVLTSNGPRYVLDDCNKKPNDYENPIDNKKPNVGASKDPNEMAGPLGKGNPETQRFLEPGEQVSYTVYYENDPKASAAAQEVFVTNSLSQYLDWSTFEMGEVVFGDQIDLGLAGKQCATNEVTMTGTNLIVRTIVELDKVKGEVHWYQRVIDPDSGDTWPADVTGGFLPPNNPETHCGEGHLTYFIKVRDDAPRGVRIDNSASIVFDTEEAIETDPAWWNIVTPETIGVGFGETDKTVNEGESVSVSVYGGNLTAASSVKVYVTWNTASAADVDLAKGTVGNGVDAVATSLKFPLTLKWAAGEIGEKTITIPVKADALVEGEEMLTLQLAGASGMTLGADHISTVRIRDAQWPDVASDEEAAARGLAALPAGATATTESTVVDGLTNTVVIGFYTKKDKKGNVTAKAMPGYIFTGWVYKSTGKVYSAKATITDALRKSKKVVPKFAAARYLRVLADPPNGGKATGGGRYAEGKVVTLKATPTKYWSFEGWSVLDANGEDGGAAVVSKAKSLKVSATNDATYVATFKPYPKVKVTLGGATKGGTVSGAGSYLDGKTVTLKAIPKKGYAFTGWYDSDGKLISLSASCKYKVTAEGVSLGANFKKESALAKPVLTWGDYVTGRAASEYENPPVATNHVVGVSYAAKLSVSAESAVGIAKVTGLPKGLAYKSGKVSGVPTKAGKFTVSVTVALTSNKKKTWVLKVPITVAALPAYARGTFTGGVLSADGGATAGLATVSVGSTGKISGKFYEGGTNWTLSASSYGLYDGDAFICSNLVAKYSWKVTKTVKGKKTTETKSLSRKFTLVVEESSNSDTILGCATAEEVVAEGKGLTLMAWQNQWGSKYKAIGSTLFYTSKKQMYKTWASVAANGLGEYDTLSMKVATNGVVTATYKYFKGTFDATSGAPQYATYTCSSTLVPMTSADAGAEAFAGVAPVFFPPVAATGFPGYYAEVMYPFTEREVPVPVKGEDGDS